MITLKVDKSTRLYSIYPRLLREAREKIAEAFTESFVLCLALGQVIKD